MFPIQLKIIAVLTLVIAAYAWHANTLSNAVEKAVVDERNSLVIQYSKQAIKLLDNAYFAEAALQDKIKRITDDKQQALSDSNVKYNDLLKWLSSQPNSRSTRKQTSVPDSTGIGESTKGTNGQGLLQGDAENTARPPQVLIDLAGFAKQTEELKVYLLTCERQYDQVMEDQQKFRLENTPSTSSTPKTDLK